MLVDKEVELPEVIELLVCNELDTELDDEVDVVVSDGDCIVLVDDNVGLEETDVVVAGTKHEQAEETAEGDWLQFSR